MCKWIVACCLLLLACGKEKDPLVLAPRLSLGEVTGVTRNTAELSAQIQWQGEGVVTSCRFLYGLSEKLEEVLQQEVNGKEGEVKACISGLLAGTTYYYCLEVSNGYSVVRSDVRHFQTLPNVLPVLGELTLVYKGPFSATFQCSFLDDGGVPVTLLAFEYREKGSNVWRSLEATVGEDGFFAGKIQGLEIGTTYQIRVCAVNTVGETYSEVLEVLTDESIYNSQPGMLSEIIGTRKYTLSSLTLSGLVNGTDIRFLREMAGWDIDGNKTPGCLAELDLSATRIVSGGRSYYAANFTRQDTLGYGTFLNCQQLRRIMLPQGLKVIEEDAFKGCSALVSLILPDSVVGYHPSDACEALQEILVSPLNPAFSSVDGVLYDKDKKTLVQYPECKKESDFTLPSSVKKVAVAAFRNCLLDSIVIPSSVKELGAQVFKGSRLKKIVISDGIDVIPEAAFSECSELKVLILGEEITALSTSCVRGCNCFQELYVKAVFPPVCYTNTFSGVSNLFFRECILYVPKGSKSLYRQATGWTEYWRTIER